MRNIEELESKLNESQTLCLQNEQRYQSKIQELQENNEYLHFLQNNPQLNNSQVKAVLRNLSTSSHMFAQLSKDRKVIEICTEGDVLFQLRLNEAEKMLSTDDLNYLNTSHSERAFTQQDDEEHEPHELEVLADRPSARSARDKKVPVHKQQILSLNQARQTCNLGLKHRPPANAPECRRTIFPLLPVHPTKPQPDSALDQQQKEDIMRNIELLKEQQQILQDRFRQQFAQQQLHTEQSQPRGND